MGGGKDTKGSLGPSLWSTVSMCALVLGGLGWLGAGLAEKGLSSGPVLSGHQAAGSRDPGSWFLCWVLGDWTCGSLSPPHPRPSRKRRTPGSATGRCLGHSVGLLPWALCPRDPPAAGKPACWQWAQGLLRGSFVPEVQALTRKNGVPSSSRLPQYCLLCVSCFPHPTATAMYPALAETFFLPSGD